MTKVGWDADDLICGKCRHTLTRHTMSGDHSKIMTCLDCGCMVKDHRVFTPKEGAVSLDDKEYEAWRKGESK